MPVIAIDSFALSTKMLDRDGRGQFAVRAIAHQLQIFVAHSEQPIESAQEAPLFILNLKTRQRQRLAPQQRFHLLKMVPVDVIIAERVDKIAHLQPAHVREHVRQEGVGADVEGHSEESVSRALVELAMKYALPFNLELEESVAGRKVNAVALARIPTRDYQPTRVRVSFNFCDETRYLIHAVAPGVMAAEGAPQITVDGAEVSDLSAE